MVVWDVHKSTRGRMIDKNKSTVKSLDDLLELFPVTRLHSIDKTLQEITHIKKGEKYIGYSFKGILDEEIEDTLIEKLPNNFIHYQQDYWVNCHWIKKLKNDKIKLLNGSEITS